MDCRRVSPEERDRLEIMWPTYDDTGTLLRSPELAAQHVWLDHGFGTRASGDWLPRPETASLKQIHSNIVVIADQPGELGEGDALVTARPGLYVTIRTADCIPVLIADTRTHAVAAVHAGWRGTAGEIVSHTVRTLVSEFHSDPVDLVAIIGPGIGRCCYEVGADVAQHFDRWLPRSVVESRSDQKTMLDLVAVNRAQLNSAGVVNVIEAAPCTHCHSGMLHSFRRDGARAGRMHSAIRSLF